MATERAVKSFADLVRGEKALRILGIGGSDIHSLDELRSTITFRRTDLAKQYHPDKIHELFLSLRSTVLCSVRVGLRF